jgi:MoaA/NifB/PqqE/SkfB family radical SAM enzyme
LKYHRLFPELGIEGRKTKNVPFPRNLTIETSSSCNLKCVMCPQSIGLVKRPKKMPLFLLEKLSDQISYASTISLHGIGEPLLSESFWRLLEQIPEKCNSTVNTNLTVLTDEMLENLLSSNLSSINVSIDSPYSDDYFKIRGFNLEIILDNIRRLVGHRLKVYANMTLMVCTIDSMIDFMDLTIGEIGCDAVFVWPLNHWSAEESIKYNREVRGWDFNYEKQGLWNIDHMSKIKAASKYAKEKGWKFVCNKEE